MPTRMIQNAAAGAAEETARATQAQIERDRAVLKNVGVQAKAKDYAAEQLRKDPAITVTLESNSGHLYRQATTGWMHPKPKFDKDNKPVMEEVKPEDYAKEVFTKLCNDEQYLHKNPDARQLKGLSESAQQAVIDNLAMRIKEEAGVMATELAQSGARKSRTSG